MDFQNFINSEGKNVAKKRKFTPNITKALAKKSQAGISNSIDDTRKSQEFVGKSTTKRVRINRKALDSDEPRFVQGFSMFESGLGCAERSDRTRFERDLFPSKSNRTSSKATTEPLLPTEVQDLDNECPTLSNVHQVFKYPPNIMPSDPPEVSTQFKRGHLPSSVPSSDNLSSTHSSTSLVHELFDEQKPNGSLFSLRIPDALLYEGSPLEKSGKFGKIQILENGETRLVIGDCFFRLTSPGLAPYSTDVVLVEEEEEDVASGNKGGGGVVNLTSLGHIEQFVTAVPDLDQFTRLGR
nr:rab gap:tbc [Hymenolepis microstoma]